MEFPKYRKILEDIKTSNYVEIPMSASNKKISNVAESFLRFLKLDQETKNAFTIMVDRKDRGSNTGYVRKMKSRGTRTTRSIFTTEELPRTY